MKTQWCGIKTVSRDVTGHERTTRNRCLATRAGTELYRLRFGHPAKSLRSSLAYKAFLLFRLFDIVFRPYTKN